MHETVPGLSEKDPGSHSAQVEAPVAPTAAENLPATQLVQTVEEEATE